MWFQALHRGSKRYTYIKPWPLLFLGAQSGIKQFVISAIWPEWPWPFFLSMSCHVLCHLFDKDHCSARGLGFPANTLHSGQWSDCFSYNLDNSVVELCTFFTFLSSCTVQWSRRISDWVSNTLLYMGPSSGM